MKIYQLVSEKPIILIGSQAVSLYNKVKIEADFDFVIHNEIVDFWIKKFEEIGYKIYYPSKKIIRFKTKDKTLPLVDLLIYSQEVYGKLWAERQTLFFGDLPIFVPNIYHLINLKIFSFASRYDTNKKEKDYQDIISLIKTNNIPMNEKLKNAVNEYGDKELEKRLFLLD